MVFEIDSLVGGEPMAGIGEGLVKELHDQRDDISVDIADETLEGVGLLMERERRMLVAVEGAEGLVMSDRHAQALGYLLYREGAELFNFVLFHIFILMLLPFQGEFILSSFYLGRCPRLGAIALSGRILRGLQIPLD